MIRQPGLTVGNETPAVCPHDTAQVNCPMNPR
jgi:hypothetical protein